VVFEFVRDELEHQGLVFEFVSDELEHRLQIL
jgi:hypothetical protein